MKTYLLLTKDGTLKEEKTKNIKFNLNEYENFNKFKKCYYNNEYYYIVYNDDNRQQLNIIDIPFNEDKLYGDIIIINTDNEDNLKSFTEKKYLKLLIKNKNENELCDYSSDDFNPDTCEKLKNC